VNFRQPTVTLHFSQSIITIFVTLHVAHGDAMKSTHFHRNLGLIVFLWFTKYSYSSTIALTASSAMVSPTLLKHHLTMKRIQRRFLMRSSDLMNKVSCNKHNSICNTWTDEESLHKLAPSRMLIKRNCSSFYQRKSALQSKRQKEDGRNGDGSNNIDEF